MSAQLGISELEGYLRLTDARQRTIAANMANVDTPGYRAREIDFDRELKRADIHMPMLEDDNDASGHLMPVAREVPGLLERPDGNNVSLDRESMLLAQTQLEHQLGVQLIKSQFHSLLTAINGGNQG